MKQPQEHTSNARSLDLPMVILLTASVFIVAITMVSALWLSGWFLPSWIQWDEDSIRTDTNGNNRIEGVILYKKHLTIADDEGNTYYSPPEWLVSDFTVADMDGGGTPEIVGLVWMREPAGGAYEIPLLGFLPGFTQYIIVFDYSQGEIEPIWTSTPVRYEANYLASYDPGTLTVTLADGSETLLRWDDPGLVPAN